MKIEILMPGQTPKIFKLLKSETLLGASSECDIQINAEGISKKHLLISEENNHYFATDLGGHNGTYYGGARLQAREKKEISLSSPIVLSKDVILSLILDDEVSEEAVLDHNQLEKQQINETGRTQVFSLKELEQNAKQDFLKKRKQIRQNNKYIYKKKSTQSSNGKLMFFLVLLFALAVSGYFIQNRKKQVDLALDLKNKKVDSKIDSKISESGNPIEIFSSIGKFKKIDAKSIARYEILLEGFDKKKCSTALEIELCKLFPSMNLKYSGVLEKENKVFIYLHRGSFFKETEHFFQEDSKSDNSSPLRISYLERIKFMFLIFLRNHPTLDWSKYLNKDFYYIFYINQGTGPMIFSLLAAPAENFPTLQKDLTQELFNKIKKLGPEVFNDIFDFFYTYHTETIIPSEYDLIPEF